MFNTIVKFVNKYEIRSLELRKKFDEKYITWTIATCWQEFFVQLGHYIFLTLNDTDKDILNENFRNISRIDDELSDMLLHVLTIANMLNIDIIKNIRHLKNYSLKTPILYCHSELIVNASQIMDSILRIGGNKTPINVDQNYEKIFITERIINILKLIFFIAEYYNINMIDAYSNMLGDAFEHIDNVT